jgi:hypothetical protein
LQAHTDLSKYVRPWLSPRRLELVEEALRELAANQRQLVSRDDEDGRGDSESSSQVADLSNVEFAFAGENF